MPGAPPRAGFSSVNRAGEAATTLVALTLLTMLHAAPLPRAEAAMAVRVSANRLVDAAGKPLQLRGVNFSGAQYECFSNSGTVWDTPADARALRGMMAWRVNAVRLPLNEDCWLGINGLPRRYSAAAYRAAIHRWVAQLHGAGIYVLLNLHVCAPGATPSTKELPMADADHAPSFWATVASSFKDDPAVIFDLYNEPKHIDWACWRSGCGSPYPIAGMQALVNSVRSTGATQPVMSDGIDYANDLSKWLPYAPSDPRHQLVAGFHTYHDGLGCEDAHCWNSTVASVAARVPVVSGEIGEFDCAHAFVDTYMNWADPHGVSYLAWAWNTNNCAQEPSLLTSLNGRPSAYGIGVYDHLQTFRI
jgi:Cellulase (glycosyl hydrolase family 5)